MRSTDIRRGVSSASVLVLALAVGGQARAQDGADHPAELETVVVTAQKRAEDTITLPLAVSAFSQAGLQAAGVNDVNDLQKIAPGLQVVSTMGSQNQIFLRGAGTSLTNIGAEAGVTVSQDGIPLAQSLLFNTDFLDIERVEVLRGPQGTISGRNATGGTINVLSRLPTDSFSASTAATVANYGAYKLEGVVSGPLSGMLMGRLAVSTDQSQGWLRNTLIEQRLSDRELVHGRASLVATLSPDLRATLVVDAMRDHSTPQFALFAGRARGDTPSVGEFYGASELKLDKLRFQDEFRRRYSREQLTAALGVDWSLGEGANLKSTTGYVDGDIVNEFGDGLPLFVQSFPFFEYHTRQFTQELTLTADLGDRADLVAGALYIDSKTSEPIEYDAPSVGLVPGFLRSFPEQRLKSYSGYAQVRYRATDRVRLSAGVRYTRDDKTYDQTSPLPFLVGGGSASWDAWTPRFAVDVQVSETTMVFADIARGFKEGGFNTFSVNPVNVFNPETVWNAEVGVKGRYFNRRLNVSATAFRGKYENLQETLFGTNYTPSVVNAPGASVNGAEFEMEALVGEHWRLNASGTYLDARYDDLLSADPVHPERGLQNLDGNRLSSSPKYQATAAAEYSRPVSDTWTLWLRGSYAWRSAVYTTIYNTPEARIGGYGVLGLSAALENTRAGLKLTAWGRNVTDKRYLSSVGISSTLLTPGRFIQVGEPRTYGLTLSKSF